MRFSVAAAACLLLLGGAYANHFHNSFHFDDFHTITQNPFIRSLRNVPRFFTDARTFSILPAHYSYRPLVSASLALDYRLAKGLDPLWFHISTFFWFTVQLALMYLLFAKIMNHCRPGPQNAYLALVAVAWYGLHPANAETVNYVIQRGDLYAALSVVAGLVVYAYWPRGRKWGIYLAPVAAGALAKPSALVFPALLFLYSLLLDESGLEAHGFGWSRLRRHTITCLPSAAVCGVLAILQVAMTPPTFVTGAVSRSRYWLTQPIVALHYFKSFFLPTELTADTDRPLVPNFFSEASIVGLVFLGVLLFAIRRAVRNRAMCPAAFGLLWFLIALLPTSVIPLAEPDNDHRMFFPFVGLTLAVTWKIGIFVENRGKRWAGCFWKQAAVLALPTAVLAASAYGTHVRNAVWRSEESLWLDVTDKSPNNGRGLMNYGLTQMAKGNTQAAYNYFQRATAFTPDYATLEVNLGIAAGVLDRDVEAEQHFRRAMTLAPEDAQSYSFYGRWLQTQGRLPQAISVLNRAVELNQADLDPRYTLMLIYMQQSDWADLQRVSSQTLLLAPEDASALRYAVLARHQQEGGVQAPPGAAQPLTAESYLNLSRSYYESGRYEDCIRAARQALQLRPSYAEAYNNLAAAYQSTGRWDQAIVAAQQAIRLKPDFQLAQNNLAYAISQKRLVAMRKN